MKRLFTLLLFSVAPLFPIAYAQPMLVGVISEGGKYGAGAIVRANADGTNLIADYSIESVPGNSAYHVELVEVNNGKLLGLASGGGMFKRGVLFEYDRSTKDYKAIVDFNMHQTGGNPTGSMLKAPNGILYGTASNGGANGHGTIFEFNPATNQFKKKHDFDGVGGSFPTSDLIYAPNGMLYGVTYRGGNSNFGVLYEINPVTNAFTVKHHFDGNNGVNPYGKMLLTKSGKIFGMASIGGAFGRGTIYEFSYITGAVTKRVDFSGTSNGAEPYGRLLEGEDGLLYGMTLLGGASDKGTLFTFNPATYQLVKKYDFGSVGPGTMPYGSLMQASNGLIYGTTEQGLLGAGGLFEYHPASGAMTSVLAFENSRYGIGGTSRCTPMQASDGKIYGTTTAGGLALAGTIFSYNPMSGEHELLVNFNAAPFGNLPIASLVQADNGKFYGTTLVGGTNWGGFLFEYDISQSEFTKKVEFSETLGMNVFGAMAKASSGKLYGLARQGGTEGNGTLFEYDASTSVYTKKVDFVTHLGSPTGSLAISSDGSMYGVTYNGGNFDMGTLFKYDLAANTVQKLVDFNGTSQGRNPTGYLLIHSNKVYGLTQYGGSSDDGVFFEYDIASQSYSVLRHFNRLGSGAWPVGGLVKAKSNKFYGATNTGGSFGFGTIFEYDPSTKIFVKKVDLENDESLGAILVSGFVESSNGKLYASFSQGGGMGLGSFMEYDPVTNIVIKKNDFIGSNGANNQSGPLVFASMQPQSLTFAPLPEKKYGDPPFTLTATTNSVFPITFTSSDPSKASISGNTVTIHGGGTVEITAFVPGNINLHSAKVTRTLLIKKLEQTLSFEAIPDKKTIDDPFVLTATASSNLPVSFTSSNLETVQIFGDVATITGAGEVEITATQEGNLIYEKVEAKRKFKVTKVSQTITFEAIPDKTMLDLPFKLEATVTSGLPVSFTISDTSIATISGDMVTIKKAGTATITARQPGNHIYEASAFAIRSLKVSKIDQVITFEAIPGLTTRVTTYALNITSTTENPIVITSSDTVVAKVSGTNLQIIREGTSRITASQPGNNIYNPSNVITHTLMVRLVTSVDGEAALLGYKAYPNPASDVLILNLPIDSGNITEIRAYDMLGRLTVVPVERMESGEYKCYVGHLSSGRYTLQIQDSEVKISIIVMH